MATDIIRGWKLDRQQRTELLARFPLRYGNPVADHVTFKPDDAAMPDIGEARIVGRADDGSGVDAMVVAIDGSTERPDGGAWHITWSLAHGRKARESNDVIAEHGWAALDGPMLILTPAEWERTSG